MKLFYQIFVFCYGVLIRLAANFSPKAKLWVDGRINWQEKIIQKIKTNDLVIWMHCSSLGEFEQGKPILEKLRIKYPNHKLAVSFFSPSGYEVSKDYKGADLIFYLPLDSISNAKKLIQVLHPSILILVKYEYWFNLLDELYKRKIKTIVVSAIFREDQLYFKKYATWFQEKLQHINHFFVQNNESKKILQSIHIDNIIVSGDTRFDRVKNIYKQNNKLDFIHYFKANKNLLVAGSTWLDDEKMLTQLINNHLPKNWNLVIAPHNIDSHKINILRKNIKAKTILYSEIKDFSDLKDAPILIVDAIGFLTQIYAYADLVYVGGGFTKSGVHNVLEPAVFGSPVIIGPQYKKYQEVIDLIKNKGCKSFDNELNIINQLNFLMNNESERKEMGVNAFNFVKNTPNASEIILDYIHENIT